VHAALGTQVIGSTIRPASFCGCFAFKPSMGALNRSGSFDHLSHSCLGVLGPDLASLWQVAGVIAAGVGGDPGYPAFGGAGELAAPQRPGRLAALYPPAFSRAAPGARAALADLLERLKAAGIEIADSRTDQQLAAVSTHWVDAEERVQKIIDWEMRWPLGAYAAEHSSLLSERLRQRLADGRRLSCRDYQEQLEWRAVFREEYGRASHGFDAAITLSALGAAPRGWHFTGDPGLNVMASVLGVPSISLPLLADEGMPLGLQVIGRYQGDVALFAVSRWLAENVGRTPTS
jgi:Asp-tRNA(Asn)/Glu-tRNA(Gln) amidotransferase A subunit family amidase